MPSLPDDMLSPKQLKRRKWWYKFIWGEETFRERWPKYTVFPGCECDIIVTETNGNQVTFTNEVLSHQFSDFSYKWLKYTACISEWHVLRDFNTGLCERGYINFRDKYCNLKTILRHNIANIESCGEQKFTYEVKNGKAVNKKYVNRWPPEAIIC